nr:MAG TPA: hypothetical protein [Caudoviricetes sp.]
MLPSSSKDYVSTYLRYVVTSFLVILITLSNVSYQSV